MDQAAIEVHARLVEIVELLEEILNELKPKKEEKS